MRILCDAFNDGHRMIYRTSDDGRKIERVYEGDHPRAPVVPGRRICAFIELGWERSPQGFDAAEADLQRLLEIVRELREETQNGSRNASKRRKGWQRRDATEVRPWRDVKALRQEEMLCCSCRMCAHRKHIVEKNPERKAPFLGHF